MISPNNNDDDDDDGAGFIDVVVVVDDDDDEGFIDLVPRYVNNPRSSGGCKIFNGTIRVAIS